MRILNIEKLEAFLLLFFMLFTLVLPTAVFNKVIFAIMILCYLVASYKIVCRINGPLVVFLIFLYGYFVSLFTNSDGELARSFLLAVFLLFLIYPIVLFDLPYEKIITMAGKIFIIVDLIFAIYMANKHHIVLPFGLNSFDALIQKTIPTNFFELIEEFGEISIGKRGIWGDSAAMVHIGTIPFVYLPICLCYRNCLREKKWKEFIWVILGIMTIVLSTSRALLFMTIIMLAFLTINEQKKVGVKFVLIVGVIFIGLLSLLYIIQNTTALSTAEYSNSVKINHILSAFKSMTPIQFLFGKGLAAYYYSTGVNRCVAQTEITLIDYFRYFGIILGGFVYLKLLFPLPFGTNRICIRQKHCMAETVIFGGYLIISLTNPVLMNSMGLLVVLWYWDILCRSIDGENNESCSYNCSV